MTTLLWQTALMLLCAYFLGAWIACIVRRAFFGRTENEREFVPVGAGAAMRSGDGQIVTPPKRRPDPRPTPIETIERQPPHATADAASRFEEALTTAPKVAPAPATVAAPPQPKPAAPAAPIAPATAAPVVRPAAPAPIVPAAATTTPAATVPPVVAKPVAPTPVPSPVPSAVKPAAPVVPAAAPTPAAPVVNRVPPAVTSPASPPTPAPAPVAASPASPAAVDPKAVAGAFAGAGAAAALAQAAAAALTTSARQTPAAPAASQAAPLVLPSASSGGGPSAVAAPRAAAPMPDDLTRIRGIDPALEKSLGRLGITRYRDIAAWLPDDVGRISKALNFHGRIEQENWIEQAQILARGGDTDYSRRRDRGLISFASPSPDAGAAPSVAPAASKPAAVVAPVPPTDKLAAPVAAPRASDPDVNARAAFADRSRSEKPAVTVTPAPVAMPAAPIAPANNAPVAATAGAAAAAAAAAASKVVGASGMQRDNLQRISGINAEIERLLNVQGISRYAQIASWTPVDAGRLDRLLGQEGRVSRENWIEQAAMLARGGDTAHSRQFDQQRTAATRQQAPAAATAPVASEPKPVQTPAPRPAANDAAVQSEPRPSRLVDAIRDTAAKGSDAPAPASNRQNEMAGLRSVRSELYAPAGRTGQQDDLKRIRGVGVLIEKKLNSMGVYSYQQVANWSSSDIDRVSQVLDFRGRIERENWVEQARILSAGGQTEFSRRVDRGDVDSSRNR